MATVFDVAAYILAQKGEMTAMKLQKLVYYSQAWALVWDDAPLFDERIEAWANGPVCPDLYREHAGQFRINQIARGDAARMTEDERDSIDTVLQHYGDKDSYWLSDMTHSEPPWIDARGDAPAGSRCNNEITLASMAEYYGSL